MPEISRFYGIIIKMFFKPKEHEPSHIHALYGEYIGVFDLKTCTMTDGDLANYRHYKKRVKYMIPRIKKVTPQSDYKLLIAFDGGETVIYDVMEDILQIPDFTVLKTEYGLFENVQLDESRTCIYWSDRVDLPSDTLLEYGKKTC